MTSSELLLPLRIPELGPFMGKLVTGTGMSPPQGIPLDAIRYELVTRIIESAGEARRLAARDERSAAIFALSPVFWLTAWEATVNAVASALLERVGRDLVREADLVRMPVKRRGSFLPGPSARRALTARLGSAGAALVPALDELGRRGAVALTATAAQADDLEKWRDALCTAARRLEAAWLALEEQIDPELAHWAPVLRRVAAWRRALTPVWITGAVLLPLSVWLGLMLGGFLPAPAWIAAFLNR